MITKALDVRTFESASVLLNAVSLFTQGNVTSATTVQIELFVDQCREVCTLLKQEALVPRTVGLMVTDIRHLIYLCGNELDGTPQERILVMANLEQIERSVVQVAVNLGEKVKEVLQ